MFGKNSRISYNNLFFLFGVQLFFLLSAFSIFYGYFNRLNDREGIKKYLLRRFLRIAPLFYFLIASEAVLSCFGGTGHSFNEYLINITFIFNFFPGQHQSIVGAGWPIGVLFIFYLLVPVLIAFVRKISIALTLLVGVLFVSSYYYKYMNSLLGDSNLFGYMSIITQLPFFMMGIVLFLVMRKILLNEKILEKRLTKIIGLGLVVFAISLASTLIWVNPLFLILFQTPYIIAAFCTWGLVFSCLIAGFILYPCKIYVNKVTKFIGDRSYSIYLIHPIVLSILMPIYQAIYGWINDWTLAFFISVLITLPPVLGFASLLYEFIEKPAFKYGERLLLKNR